MDIVVFGAGSLGSLLGGLLATEHDVTLVGRDPHVGEVAEGGLRITGALERSASPRAVKRIGDGEADLALVTVKAHDTAAAAGALSDCDLGVVLSLQNGMGNEATLAGRLPCPVLAGTTTFGASIVEPGVVECTGVGSVTLGPLPDVGTGTDAIPGVADDVAAAFRVADIVAHVSDDMRSVLWEKLAVNAGINPITALARVENGAVLDDPLWPIADRAAAEVAGVARSAGVDLSDATAREALDHVASETAANRSSMLQDVASRRRTEIDAISGFVIEHADDAVPVNRTLAALVRGWESARGLR